MPTKLNELLFVSACGHVVKSKPSSGDLLDTRTLCLSRWDPRGRALEAFPSDPFAVSHLPVPEPRDSCSHEWGASRREPT